MKLYTGAGDSGRASTHTRMNIPKSSPVFELLGTLDEFTSTLGVARQKTPAAVAEILARVQENTGALCEELSVKAFLFQRFFAAAFLSSSSLRRRCSCSAKDCPASFSEASSISTVVPNISASLNRFAVLGVDWSVSHLPTACRLTPTNSATFSCDIPALRLQALILSPKVMPGTSFSAPIILDAPSFGYQPHATIGCIRNPEKLFYLPRGR